MKEADEINLSLLLREGFEQFCGPVELGAGRNNENATPRSDVLQLNSTLSLLRSNFNAVPVDGGYGGYGYTAKPAVGEPASYKLILEPNDKISIPKSSRFFVIKSFNGQDVRDSFFSKRWSSSDAGNNKLNRIWKQLKQAHNEYTTGEQFKILLFFSISSSNKFCGIAELKSELISNKHFAVQWLCVKDVGSSRFKHLVSADKPVTSARDCQELAYDVGVAMFGIFRKTPASSSFLM